MTAAVEEGDRGMKEEVEEGVGVEVEVGVWVLEGVEEGGANTLGVEEMAANRASAVEYPRDEAMPESESRVIRVPSVRMDDTREVASVTERMGVLLLNWRLRNPLTTWVEVVAREVVRA
jgi:hypothetical protein